MIHEVLRPQYPNINNMHVYRIYTAECLSIREHKKTKRIGVRVPLMPALAVNQTWSMGFVNDAINKPGAVSRRIECLTVPDDFNHECVDITAIFGTGGDFAMNALMRTGSNRWNRPANLSPHREPTTTRSGRTAVAGVYRLQTSPLFIVS